MVGAGETGRLVAPIQSSVMACAGGVLL